MVSFVGTVGTECVAANRRAAREAFTQRGEEIAGESGRYRAMCVLRAGRAPLADSLASARGRPLLAQCAECFSDACFEVRPAVHIV